MSCQSRADDARDGRLVVTGVGANLVGATIRRKCTEACSSAARVVIAVILNDIVFSLRAVDPAVYRKVRARASSIVVCRVGNGSSKMLN